MTLKEENEQLRAKIKEYEEMLQEILEEGELTEGIISSDSFLGQFECRVLKLDALQLLILLLYI